MEDPGKKMEDAMLGAIGGFAGGGAVARMLEQQRSVVRLSTLNGFDDDALRQEAFGLPKREITNAVTNVAAASRLAESQLKIGSALGDLQIRGPGLHDSIDKYGQIQRQIDLAKGKIGALTGSPFGKALAATDRFSLFAQQGHAPNVGKAFEEAMAKINTPFNFDGLSAATQIALGLDVGSVGALSRSRIWASAIGAISDDRIDALLGASLSASELGELRGAVGGIAAASERLGLVKLRSGSLRDRLTGMEATSEKLSLYAGSIDVLGPGAPGSTAAYDALLGGYSVHEILARSGMPDQRERARLYRDLNVDDGLIEGDNATTVAVLVESGLVEGELTRSGTVTALIEAGPVRMRIMASRPRIGAFCAIDAFETSLRAFVSAKLEASHGQNWFKQRVPGDLVGRAKKRRLEAIRAGEPSRPLIGYIDLGDLMAVIMRKDNWIEMFEAVFDRLDHLRVDFERLTAFRRPTMHGRAIDPVQLCEIVLTIRRLTDWMKRDGAWQLGWDADI